MNKFCVQFTWSCLAYKKRSNLGSISSCQPCTYFILCPDYRSPPRCHGRESCSVCQKVQWNHWIDDILHIMYRLIKIIDLCLLHVFSGLNLSDLETLPVGVALPIWDSIVKCQENPPSTWPQAAYDIVGRSYDLHVICRSDKRVPSEKKMCMSCNLSVSSWVSLYKGTLSQTSSGGGANTSL